MSSSDLVVNFSVILLLTRVPSNLLKSLFSLGIAELFNFVLTPPTFLYEVHNYEQKDEVAMGSPLFPVAANFFMEHKALENAPPKIISISQICG